MRGLAWMTSLGAVAVAACADPPSSPPTFGGHVRGFITFEADYQDIDPLGPATWGPPPQALTEGRIPNGTTGMRRLWVCAYDANHEESEGADTPVVDPDPSRTGPPDDVLLGCGRVDDDGSYDLEISSPPDDNELVDLYLVTWFCDGPTHLLEVPGSGETYPVSADYCVSQNLRNAVAPTESVWPGGPGDQRARTKYLWSRVYPDVTPWSDGLAIAWNLSCPDQPGLHKTQAMQCDEPTQGWEAPTCEDEGYPGCVSGPNATNSNASWNKEAVHVFRAIAQSPYHRPDAQTTLPDADRWPGGEDDWIRVYLKQADQGDPDQRSADCPASCARNGTQDGGVDWIAMAAGNCASPTGPLHELGHIVHGRWLNAPIAPPGCAQPSWGAGSNADEQARVNEGFADFWASAAWFPRDTHDVVFMSRRRWKMEDASSTELAPCPALDGEGREAQFFWDLYDDGGAADEDEAAAYSLEDLLRTWSAFSVPGTPENRSRCDGLGECGTVCQGRNINDFLFHLDALREGTGWKEVVSLDCMDAYSDPLP